MECDYDGRIKIVTFGHFDVFHPSGDLNDRGDRCIKTWDLLKYMITHKDKRITVDNIMEEVFPSEEYHDPANSIKNLVYRLRNMMQCHDGATRNTILFQKGGYYLNRTHCINLDTDTFEAISNNAAYYEKEDPIRSVELLNKGLKIYKGSYLPEDSKYDWVMPTRLYYRRLFLKNYIKHMTLLRQLNEYDEMVRIGSEAIITEEFEEDIHALFMEALLRTGKNTQVIQHYKYVADLFQKVYNVSPSSHLLRIYHHALDSVPLTGPDFNFLSNSVAQQRDCAFVCSPEVFTQMIVVDQKRNQRLHKNTCVLSLSLEKRHLCSQDQDILNQEAALLLKLLVKSMRGGDVITRWNDNTVIALMGDGTDENGMQKGRARLKKIINNDLKGSRIHITIQKLSSNQVLSLNDYLSLPDS